MAKVDNERRKRHAVEEFKTIVKDYILNLFMLEGEPTVEFQADIYKPKYIIECENSDLDTDSDILYFYPDKDNSYFRLKVNAPKEFVVKDNLKAAREILEEMLSISQYDFSEIGYPYNWALSKNKELRTIYKNVHYETALELGICNWLGGSTIFKLLKQLESWALKTYEGKKVAFSFIVDFKKESTVKKGKGNKKTKSIISSDSNFIEFMHSNHSAVFTDGITSIIKLDFNGNIKEFISAKLPNSKDNKRYVLFAPYRFQDMCNECSGQLVGIVLQTNGEILIFKNQSLLLARYNGSWKFLNSHVIVNKIKTFLLDNYKDIDETERKKVSEKCDILAKQVFVSLLDVSFTHSGCCIAIINNSDVLEAKKLFENDYLYKNDAIVNDVDSESKQEKDKIKIDEREEKLRVIKALIQTKKGLRPFSDIDRKLRQELLALDGATIIGLDGKLLASGSIVQVNGGSNEGGRAAAAKALSEYGLAIKVSMDGKITGYIKGNSVFKLL